MNDLQRAICDHVRREALAEMALEIVSIPPTTRERPAAEYVAQKFSELGMQCRFQEVEEDRWNVLLRLPGTGDGKTLLFSGHLDTSVFIDEPNHPRGHQTSAIRDGDWMYGIGMSNMKSAFAAYHEAIRALQQVGVSLRGDILVAGVVGETERGAPDSGLQGPLYRGGGFGSHYLATHGLAADCCIIGEPTGLHLAVGQTGWIFAKVTVIGVTQHTWCKEYGVDPIKKMQTVMDAIREWEPELKRLHPHPFMDTRLGIGAIEGGHPFKPSRCPAPTCSAYVDLRIPPGYRAIGIRRELQALFARLMKEDPELKVELEFYVTAPGYEIGKEEPIVRAVEDAHETVFGEPVEYARENRYCVSCDGAPYWEMGIPALTYGAGGVQREGQLAMYSERGEAVSLDNLQRCAQVYALAALALC